MTSSVVLQGAASALLGPLVADADLRLLEVARTAVSVHYETTVRALPVLCVTTPAGVRLPNALVTTALPRAAVLGDVEWRVTRWWRPARPSGLPSPGPATLASLPRPPYDVLDPAALLGRGPGLTPEGDDVLAAALVAAHATGDPRLASWRAATIAALHARSTTAVSRGLLQHALDGYAVPELSDLLTAVCHDVPTDEPLRRLLAVGHSSGRALLYGALLTLTTRPTTQRTEGAA